MGLEDIRTASLEQLIAKFRELQELRAKITGDGAANFIVDLDQLAEVDKAISNVEKSIKALTVEGGIEPLLLPGFLFLTFQHKKNLTCCGKSIRRD